MKPSYKELEQSDEELARYRRTAVMTLSFGLSLLLLGIAVTAAMADAFSSGLFGASLVLFCLVKARLTWLLRKQVSQPLPGQDDWPAQNWRWLSTGSFASAALALAAGIAGGARPWTWFLAVGAASLGWVYFVRSLHAAGKHWAA